MELDLNPVLTPVRDLGDFIREQRQAAQISVRALAAKAGVSNPYLSQVERGLRRPSAEILAQIAHGLSISVETMLAKAGILETSEAPDVVTAIRADPVLTERQKAVLVDIYAALRKEAQAASAPPGPAIRPEPPAAASVDRVAETVTAPAPENAPAVESADEPATAGPEPLDPRAHPTTPTGITPVPEGEHHAAL